MKTFAWSLVKGKGVEVASRDEHTAVLDDNTRKMVIFGGFIDGERCNDTAMYSCQSN
jgi:leucine-zipper-like transcriptional regulator 1